MPVCADQAAFTFYSDEFNGNAVDDEYCAKPFANCLPGNRRENMQKTLTIDQAIKENRDSRIFLGVHWESDQITGQLLGERIAQNIIANFPRMTGTRGFA